MIDSAALELRGHVNGCREAILSDNEQFVREVSEAFHKVRAGVLKARAQYLKIPLPSGGDVEGSLSRSLDVDDKSGGLTTVSDQPISVKGLTTDFEQLRQKYLTMGSRLVDAAIEKLLLQQEVKAARLRRASGGKNGLTAGGKPKNTGYRTNLLCPTCKPLQEANLELQRVASRLRREKSGRGDSSTRKSSYIGFGSNLDLSNVEGSIALSAPSSAYTPALFKYGRENRRSDQEVDDDASISSTDSTREADFVRRFLDKCQTKSTTLRGTLSKLDPTNQSIKFGPSALLSASASARARATSQQDQPVAPEEETPFDKMIANTFMSSSVNSAKSVREKLASDEHLVKQLLDVTIQGERSLTFGGTAADSFSSVEGRSRNSSFEVSPALIAPALDAENVDEWVRGS